MKIEYLGHSCFCLTSNAGTRIVTDPYQRVGYELPKGLCANIVTVSHEHFDHNAVSELEKADNVVKGTGAWEILDVKLEGIECDHDPVGGKLRGKNTVYKIITDGITVCHLGDLGEKCRADLLDKIGKADVLLVPIGGTYTIDAEGAKEYIERLAPKMAIAMHYRPADGTLDIDDGQKFLSLFDEVSCIKSNEELIVEKTCLKSGKTEIIFMERTKKV